MAARDRAREDTDLRNPGKAWKGGKRREGMANEVVGRGRGEEGKREVDWEGKL